MSAKTSVVIGECSGPQLCDGEKAVCVHSKLRWASECGSFPGLMLPGSPRHKVQLTCYRALLS